MIDGLLESLKKAVPVILVKAGIQGFQVLTFLLDSGFRRSDDFL